jgi:hypothetical protein
MLGRAQLRSGLIQERLNPLRPRPGLRCKRALGVKEQAALCSYYLNFDRRDERARAVEEVDHQLRLPRLVVVEQEAVVPAVAASSGFDQTVYSARRQPRLKASRNGIDGSFRREGLRAGELRNKQSDGGYSGAQTKQCPLNVWALSRTGQG